MRLRVISVCMPWKKTRVTRWDCGKIGQTVSQPVFCQNYCITLTVGKSCPVTLVIVKKLPNVNNNPLGENSPNLVTLKKRHKFRRDLFKNIFYTLRGIQSAQKAASKFFWSVFEVFVVFQISESQIADLLKCRIHQNRRLLIYRPSVT
jgi:hypothetical protein